MGKFRKKIKPDEALLRPKEEEVIVPNPAEDERRKGRREKLIAAIVFLTTAFVLAVLSAVFFGLDASRKRDFQNNYEQMQGTVIDVETRGFGKGARLALVIAYSYGGNDYVLHDGEAWRGTSEIIGKQVEILVNRENPQLAATPGSVDNFSIAGTVVTVFAAVTLVIGTGLIIAWKREK